MIALSASTAAAIALHAAEGSWIVFLQIDPPGGGQGPIKIEGMKGSRLVERLTTIAEANPYPVYLIGLMPAFLEPVGQALAIGDAHQIIHDTWYQPTGDLIAFIQHVGQEALQPLLAQTHPGGLSEAPVDIETIAEMLSVSVPTVRRMVKANAIPYLRFGRIYRFVPSDVIASLKND
jgi:excisionase family DNA binding protein